MFIKIISIFAIIFLMFGSFETKPSNSESHKKIRCFNPEKPEDMPQEVYEKYKISSKYLEESDKKDLWDQFVDWWKNVLAKFGKFIEKVGKFVTNVFSNKKNRSVNTTTSNAITESLPTPDPRKLRKDKQYVICLEYDDTKQLRDQTTKIYQLSVTTQSTTDIEKLITTIGTTTDLTANKHIVKIETTTTTATTTRTTKNKLEDRVTGIEFKEKVPVIIGMDRKAEVKKQDLITEATVVRDV